MSESDSESDWDSVPDYDPQREELRWKIINAFGHWPKAKGPSGTLIRDTVLTFTDPIRESGGKRATFARPPEQREGREESDPPQSPNTPSTN